MREVDGGYEKIGRDWGGGRRCRHSGDEVLWGNWGDDMICLHCGDDMLCLYFGDDSYACIVGMTAIAYFWG